MFIYRRFALSLMGLIVGAVSNASRAADVRSQYRSPTFAVPATTQPPTIDGTIDDAEWQHALSVDALQTTDGNVATRSARVFMEWDADNLYVAMRSPLRPGERVVQAKRHVGRDAEGAVFDDCYEIWLNAHTKSPDGEPVFFQYLGNYAGAKYDVMFEPAVGNSRPGWESGWKPANRITPDGKYWEMEVAIPRKSIYHDQPFTDGEQLSGLHFVRNFQRPFEQQNIAGIGSFSALDSHAKFILSKDAPAVHLLGVGDVNAGTLGVVLDANAPTAQTLKWSFDSDGDVHKAGELHLTPGQVAAADAGLGLDKPGKGYYRIRVTSEDGKTTYVDWSSKRQFGDKSVLTADVHDTGDKASLSLVFNPVQNFVRVEGDFIGYDKRNDIKRFTASVVDSTGKTLATQDLSLDPLAYVSGLLHIDPNSPAGSYNTRLVGYDDAGKEVFRTETPFEKKDVAKAYPWWNTKIGSIDRVIAPWTPVRADGNKVDVWGRTMTVGTAGLPAAVSTQGTEILAEPATLQLNGRAVDLVDVSDRLPASVKASPNGDRASVQRQIDDDGLRVSSNVTTEFDGLYKVQMTLTPRQPTAVKSLKIVVPIKPEFAEYFNACGEGIRYGFAYGYLPTDKTGRLWDSKQVDGQPMLVGSFVPYVWVGNEKGGLCWMADSDEGWSPNNDTPAIEIRRDDPSHVDLVFNLISTNETLDKPRTITFAFQATPVKPLRIGWRMDSWCTADSFQDFCKVEPKGGHLIWNALPFTLDSAASKKMVDARHASDMNYEWGIKNPKYHANAVPYFENNGIDKNFAPAAGYFYDEWHARVSNSTAITKSYTDFIVYNLDNWQKETGIDGWYVDNVRPVACDNIDAGRGYKLPDGRVQPTYLMFDTREHFLRVRATFQDLGKSGKIVLHMTNHMIMPWIGAADLALDGEDHVTFPEMNKDFIDFWSPARMRLDWWQQSGTAVTFLQEYQGFTNDTPPLRRVMRAYTAMNILNDVLPGANPNGQNPEVWKGRDWFGIDADDVTFVPYWDKDAAISVDGQDMLASSWRKPKSIMVAVVDRGEAGTATLHIDTAKLGLPALPDCDVIDADSGDKIARQGNDAVAVPVNRHDYRQVMISAK